MRSNKCMGGTWFGKYVWGMTLILGKGKWTSKFFKIISNPSRQVPLYTIVQLLYLPSTLLVNALYTSTNSMHLQHMNPYGWFKHVPMSWMRKMCRNWYQITFLFIIIVVSNMMNMYEVTKMNGMGVWSSNVSRMSFIVGKWKWAHNFFKFLSTP